MPVVPTPELLPLVDRWADTLGNLDLRGNLSTLADQGAAQSLPTAKDQLGAAVDALADSLAENSRLSTLVTSLESDRDRLDRKRRKWKRRLKQAEAGAVAAR